MAAEGRELGWEDSIKQDAQDYEPIPEGDYNCPSCMLPARKS